MNTKALRTLAYFLAALALLIGALILGAHHDEVAMGGARNIDLRELWWPIAVLGAAVALWFAAPALERRAERRRLERLRGRGGAP